jgi:HDOD domain
MNWLTRLFSAKPAAPTAPAAAAAGGVSRNAPAATASVARPATAPEATPALLPWLLGSAPGAEGIAPAERQALAALDQTLALAALPDELLPRAAALVPQMLAMLRQTDLPVQALAQRVAKDAQLTAEVMRLAGSPYYRAQGGVSDLGQAITLIGVSGLNTVIARVVLKPIYEAAPGPLSARAAPRLWEHADALASQTSVLAAEAGGSAFDGTLAGLLHGCGHSVALRLLDRCGVALALPPSGAFAAAIDERAHRLFGLAAQRWNITPAFTAFAADARSVPLVASADPLAVALRQARALLLSDLGTAPQPG